MTESQEEKVTATESDVGTEPVVLQPEQYEALLDKIEELEERLRHKEYSVDELAQEAKQFAKTAKTLSPPQVPARELDEMSNRELYEYIVNSVQETLAPMAQEITTKLETLRIMREIDKCEAKYDDFWDYRDEILKIGSENPTLSIEDAYKLAKSRGEKPAKAAGERKSTALVGLPPRPRLRPVPSSEKPGTSTAAVKEAPPASVRDAVERAWQEVMGEKETL